MILESITILGFLIMIFGYGYSILELCKTTKNNSLGLYILEMLAVGLSFTALLGIIFDFLHIPLMFPLYVGLAIIIQVTIMIIQLLKKRIKTTLIKKVLKEQ